MDFDSLVIGAGPTGLGFAKALADAGLRVAVIEKKALADIAQPAFDGREIALTHLSKRVMQKLGIWQHIDASHISALKDAQIFNGLSLHGMRIAHQDSDKSELGYLVSNHLIRQASYQAVQDEPNVHLLTESEVRKIEQKPDAIAVHLADNTVLTAPLLVAADSRFSETRRAVGISATMHDFGKVMLVCNMQHTVPHHHVAWEWFDYGQTLALLPMNGLRSSVVITVPAQEAQALMQMSETDFNAAVTERFHHRLGAMQLTSSRHAYPLVTAYAKQFVAPRFALIGDAAVGMHPVTAHGYNFGLRSIETLSSEIITAHQSGKDIANSQSLRKYERTHRANTGPLFIATHAIAKLYSNPALPARVLRTASLHLGNRINPFKRAVAHMLTE